MSPERLSFPMSQQAFNALENRKAVVESESNDAHKNLGEAGDDDWHGEFAFEHFQRETSMYRARLADLRALLQGAEIIPMRQETEDVGLYNDVTILFDGESEPESYTLTEQADIFVGIRSAVSVKSPLGLNLLGKQKGDTVVFDVEQGNQKFQQKVQILDIRPGSLDLIESNQ